VYWELLLAASNFTDCRPGRFPLAPQHPPPHTPPTPWFVPPEAASVQALCVSPECIREGSKQHWVLHLQSQNWEAKAFFLLVSMLSDSSQQFTSIEGGRYINHVILKVWVWGSQFHLAASTCWDIALGGRTWTVLAWISHTYRQEAGPGSQVPRQTQALCPDPTTPCRW
jgi:hypothetical protein